MKFVLTVVKVQPYFPYQFRTSFRIVLLYKTNKNIDSSTSLDELQVSAGKTNLQNSGCNDNREDSYEDKGKAPL